MYRARTFSRYLITRPAHFQLPLSARTMSTQHLFGEASNTAATTYAETNPPNADAPPSSGAAPAASGGGDDAKAAIKIVSHNQYESPHQTLKDFDPSPFVQFRAWFANAQTPTDGQPAVREPEAVCVSTASAQGIPSARFVLLKGADDRGFIFFTNYTSRKSTELLENPYASMVFYWKEQARQVRIVGKVEKVSPQESEEYFYSRPRGSQIGAWASQQSSVIGEDTLSQRVQEYEAKFGEGKVDRPEHWGGWRIVPL